MPLLKLENPFYLQQSAEMLTKFQRAVDSMEILSKSSLLEGQNMTVAFLQPEGWYHINYTPIEFKEVGGLPHAVIHPVGNVFWTRNAKKTIYHDLGQDHLNNDAVNRLKGDEWVLESGEKLLPQNYEVDTNNVPTYFPLYRQVWVEYPKENPPQIFISIKVGQPRPIEIIESMIKTA
jgi:hypothetical protein